MKMNLIDERCVPECKVRFEGLFCTSIMKLLFCMCSHLLTRLTIVMKVRVQLAALFHLGMNLKVGCLFTLLSDWVFHGVVAMALLAGIHLQQISLALDESQPFGENAASTF